MNKVTSFFQQHITKVLGTVVFILLLDLLAQLPYLAPVLLHPYPLGKYIVISIFIFFYFKVPSSATRFFSLFWLCIGFVALLLRRESIAEPAGVVWMVLFAVSFVQEWYETYK